MKRTILILIVSLLFPTSFLFAIPVPGPGFGGIVTLPIFCTCNFAWHITFIPPHPVQFPWVTRSLVFQPGISIPYAYQQFILPAPTPTAWELGTFTPGAGICLIGAPPACVLLPADGLIQIVGSSFPGFFLP